MTSFAVINSTLVRRGLLSCGLLLSLVCGTHAVATPITTGTFQGNGGSITFSAATLVSLNYTLTSDTGDSWTGVFDIPDMNAQAGIYGPTSVTNITAVNGGTTLSFVPDYYGSNSEGYVTWAGYGGPSLSFFNMWSLTLRNLIGGGGTWNDLVSTGTFNLSPDPGSDSIFRVDAVSPPAPVPEIDPAGMGSVLALVTGSLGLLERRRKRS